MEAGGRGTGGCGGGALLGIGLPPAARRKVERFYERIDHDLAEEVRERRRRAKKARRKAKRRLKRLLKGDGGRKRREWAQGGIIDLLGGKGEVRHA